MKVVIFTSLGKGNYSITRFIKLNYIIQCNEITQDAFERAIFQYHHDLGF